VEENESKSKMPVKPIVAVGVPRAMCN